MFSVFVSGGALGMCLITLFLIALFFAAWKAPAWVEEIGIAALVAGILWSLYGFYRAFSVLQGAPDVAPGVLYGGLKAALIPIIYSLLVYLASLIIRIVQKPRI